MCYHTCKSCSDFQRSQKFSTWNAYNIQTGMHVQSCECCLKEATWLLEYHCTGGALHRISEAREGD